jgi:hypothetical protein
MSEQQIEEFKLKFEALCTGYDIPFFFSVVFFRDETEQIKAIQLKQSKTRDLSIIIAGNAVFNGALHAMKAACGGYVISEKNHTAYKQKDKPTQKNHEHGKSN